MANKTFKMTLTDVDLHYIKYALKERIKIWDKTAAYFRDETVEGEIEEANSEYEADTIAKAYYKTLNKVISYEEEHKEKTTRIEEFIRIIKNRASYWESELEDVRNEVEGVKSIREEDAEWMLSEYDWVNEQLQILTFKNNIVEY